MAVLELQDVRKEYSIGEVVTMALNGVSLEIEEGEFTTLVGPSGSGKTTMLQLMGCLDLPDAGRVLINNQDVTSYKKNQRADLRREMIGFIFQFFALVPVLNAYENVELPLLLNNVPQKERKERVNYLLESVGLSHRTNHRPDQLSGGEQQRVAIARALAPEPLLVLADEPTANLDTENGAQAMDIMERLNRETGSAFVFATHDPRVVTYARRVVTLQDGIIVDDRNKQPTNNVEEPVEAAEPA
jgi:putative ABC transport system ATP-binding protein